ncbi:hypothetical protein CRUP_009089 [Coryphaenoides rupestris]|nr:hypothetical protein CRUP_009089 [Coryphaenoides rupestris]
MKLLIICLVSSELLELAKLMNEQYKPPSTEANPTLEDPTPDYMNLLGMIFSMRVSVGWKDSDWTTAFPTGSFKVREP